MYYVTYSFVTHTHTHTHVHTLLDVMCLMSELCKDVSGKCTHLDNCSSLLSGIDRLSRTCCREFRTLWRAITNTAKYARNNPCAQNSVCDYSFLIWNKLTSKNMFILCWDDIPSNHFCC